MPRRRGIDIGESASFDEFRTQRQNRSERGNPRVRDQIWMGMPQPTRVLKSRESTMMLSEIAKGVPSALKQAARTGNTSGLSQESAARVITHRVGRANIQHPGYEAQNRHLERTRRMGNKLQERERPLSAKLENYKAQKRSGSTEYADKKAAREARAAANRQSAAVPEQRGRNTLVRNLAVGGAAATAAGAGGAVGYDQYRKKQGKPGIFGKALFPEGGWTQEEDRTVGYNLSRRDGVGRSWNAPQPMSGGNMVGFNISKRSEDFGGITGKAVRGSGGKLIGDDDEYTQYGNQWMKNRNVGRGMATTNAAVLGAGLGSLPGGFSGSGRGLVAGAGLGAAAGLGGGLAMSYRQAKRDREFLRTPLARKTFDRNVNRERRAVGRDVASYNRQVERFGKSSVPPSFERNWAQSSKEGSTGLFNDRAYNMEMQRQRDAQKKQLPKSTAIAAGAGGVTGALMAKKPTPKSRAGWAAAGAAGAGGAMYGGGRALMSHMDERRGRPQNRKIWEGVLRSSGQMGQDEIKRIRAQGKQF